MPTTDVVGLCAAASRYAAVRSVCAFWATVLFTCWVPFVWTNAPVTLVPGDSPMSPLTVDGVALVTVVPAITANEVAVPSGTGTAAAEAVDAASSSPPLPVVSSTTAAAARSPVRVTDGARWAPRGLVAARVMSDMSASYARAVAVGAFVLVPLPPVRPVKLPGEVMPGSRSGRARPRPP